MVNFHIDRIDLSDFPVLGEGVWSRVHDLLDGTVVKLVRAESSGLKTGQDKFDREIKVLSALSSFQSLQNLVPQILAYGAVPKEILAGRDGHKLWVRMTKKEGRSLNPEFVAALGEADRQRLGRNLGVFIARLHRALAEVDMEPIVWSGGPFDELKEAVCDHEGFLQCIDTVEKEYLRIFESFSAVPCHNDCNVSNLLYSDMAVSGVLDFAECNHNFPEKDISDILKTFPFLETSLVQGYEQESGACLSPRRIIFGLAEIALYDAVIHFHKGDRQKANVYYNKLSGYMAELGYAIP